MPSVIGQDTTASGFDPGLADPPITFGVWGDSGNGDGVVGSSSHPAPGTGPATGPGGAGVFGLNNAVGGVGVRGQANQETGIAVMGTSAQGVGVTAMSTSGTALHARRQDTSGAVIEARLATGALAGDFSGDVKMSGVLAIGGGLKSAAGPLVVQGGLAVTGASSVTGALTIAGGALTVDKITPAAAALEVHKGLKVTGGPLEAQQGLQVTGNSSVTGALTVAGRVGVNNPAPLARLHVRDGGGFGAEDGNGVLTTSNVPLLAQSDSTVIGVLNAQGRPAFALNIDANGGTTTTRGIPTLYDRFDGSWHPCLSLKNGSVGVRTASPQRRLHVEGTEIHSGGQGGGLSFGNRNTASFVESPSAGERWVWYAHGGSARLWSGSDRLSVSAGGDLSVSGHLKLSQQVMMQANQTISSTGRLHIAGEELLYLLNKSGVIVGKEWGGNGNLHAQGGIRVDAFLATNGLATTNNGAGDTAGPGFPSWSGGGINTFDVVARGALYAGTDIENPQVQIHSSGVLIAKDKRFRIDHPLNSERHLVHASLEGPETGVYYRGEAQLDAGEAVVTLPAYFEALTRDEGTTVMITPILNEHDQASALAVSAVRAGAFRVRATDVHNPAQRFYWEVKAVRADIEPLQVEVEKSTHRRLCASPAAESTRPLGNPGGDHQKEYRCHQ